MQVTDVWDGGSHRQHIADPFIDYAEYGHACQGRSFSPHLSKSGLDYLSGQG